MTAGVVTLALVAAACALAWQPDSPLVPRNGGHVSGTAPLFLALLAGWVRRLPDRPRREPARRTVDARCDRAGRCDPARPARSAAAPLDGRLDVLVLRLDRNPRRRESVRRSSPVVSREPGASVHGSAWVDTTSVYGPAFTLASEPLAVVAGDSADAAAWAYKALAAAASLAAALLAGRLARRRAFAIALVGWNPLLAVHLAGGGHNDAWVGALIMAALALSAVPPAAERRRRCGRSRSRSNGCRSSFSLSGRSRRARPGRATAHRGFAVTAAVVVVAATVLYGRRLAACDRPAGGQRGARDELRDPPPARAARRPARRRARPRRRRVRRRLRVARPRGRAEAGPGSASPPACPRDDAVSCGLVPGLGGASRRGRRGRTATAAPPPLRVSPAADDPGLAAISGSACEARRRRPPDGRRASGGRAGEPHMRVEARAAGVVEVARPRRVDGDPPRLPRARES